MIFANVTYVLALKKMRYYFGFEIIVCAHISYEIIVCIGTVYKSVVILLKKFLRLLGGFGKLGVYYKGRGDIKI